MTEIERLRGEVDQLREELNRIERLQEGLFQALSSQHDQLRQVWQIIGNNRKVWREVLSLVKDEWLPPFSEEGQ